jgi:hypothetical protein
MENEWLKNPKINQRISPQKLMLLNQLLGQSNMKSKDELIPFFISAATQANSMGMSFSDAETDAILDVLKETMPEADRTRVETIKSLAKMISKKNGL